MHELTRRTALTATAALAAATVAAPRASAEGHDHGSSEAFDEVYQGRRIRGRSTGGHHGDYLVTVDGVELHLMRNSDGTWISVVSHYAPVPTPRAAARAAVDELQGARLLPFPAN